MEPLGLGMTEAAKKFRVSRNPLSDVIHGHSGISPEMAIRLDKPLAGLVAEQPKRGQSSKQGVVAPGLVTYVTEDPRGQGAKTVFRPRISRLGMSLSDFQDLRTEPAFSHASTSPGTI